MGLIDLTMPLWTGAGYGEILLSNTPLDFTEYMDYEKNGLGQTRKILTPPGPGL
ncbi:MAG TPA: hypothetical protein VLX11_09120 [Candidatus Acidoferrales bacterium]|nr:hypothetical protein [Candidatus Acidoferrales bacterium]